MAFVQLEKQLATGKQLWGNILFRLRGQHLDCPIDVPHFPWLCARADRYQVFRGYFFRWSPAPVPEEFSVVCGISVVSVATRVVLGNTQLKMLEMSTGSKCSLT